MQTCPCCEGSGFVPDRLTILLSQWRAYIDENNVWLSADDRVNAETAAELLELKESYLANLRYRDAGPEFVRGKTITYKLLSLAAWKISREK